ncbi:MAG TPA: hypothetical protein VJX67_26545 [Blastocatellia bacterium]|nr:hypothetical protein [Blastocatellia bacterium]
MKHQTSNRNQGHSSLRNKAIGGAALVATLVGLAFITLPLPHVSGARTYSRLASDIPKGHAGPDRVGPTDRNAPSVSEAKGPIGPGKKRAPTSAQTDTTIEAQVIPLKTWGFDPSQVTRRQGLVFLLVPNRSGVATVNLHLTQATQAGGVDVATVALPMEQTDWTPLVNLTPGNYTLSETNHPNWVCQITVTP